jgi:rRNA-processing protein EBP2
MTINNGSALIASRDRIAVVQPSYKFHLHNSLISNLPPASASIADPNDDLTRELEFYRIAREAAVEARQLLKKEKVPFSRPTDYFAEMVKSDEHMGRIKQKMYDDAASKKAGEEARKLRDAKKYGKAVQVAKEQERAKEKRNTLDKIKELKRKRKGQDTGKVTEGEGGDDLFQSIDVENDPTKDQSGRERGGPPGNVKRQKRDQKFGFGGKKRFSKSGDAASSADMRGFSAAKMKGKPKRPGKSRRAGAH